MHRGKSLVVLSCNFFRQREILLVLTVMHPLADCGCNTEQAGHGGQLSCVENNIRRWNEEPQGVDKSTVVGPVEKNSVVAVPPRPQTEDHDTNAAHEVIPSRQRVPSWPIYLHMICEHLNKDVLLRGHVERQREECAHNHYVIANLIYHQRAPKDENNRCPVVEDQTRAHAVIEGQLHDIHGDEASKEKLQAHGELVALLHVGMGLVGRGFEEDSPESCVRGEGESQ
mmetsp:Transcript_32409/g.69052  ORF Transcript_32409/g.69052 Transcript_32409/m.69052 type:complete len:227 (-) Transcript_32409:537-1217(-)